MSAKKNHIPFGLIHIHTVEFAIFKEMYIETGSKIDYSIGAEFGVKSLEDHKIICSPEVTFIQGDKPFIKIKIACHFSVEPEAWNQYINHENNSIVFPKGFTDHLLMLSVGTLRGVLHAKTENTIFNRFLLPTVNVVQLYNGDVEVKFEK